MLRMILAEAVSRGIEMRGTEGTSKVVHAYLEALGNQDWDELEKTLAETIVRMGPYGDVVAGRTAYRDFLADIVPKLGNYELRVGRIATIDGTTWVRLSETYDDASGRRLRTEEALVFDTDPQGQISGVEVYLRKSEVLDAEADISSDA